MVQTAVISAVVMGGFGILFALGLAYAANKFRVDTDPRVELLTNILPGANCGGCGFSGCQNFAEALVADQAELANCRACSPEALAEASALLGKEVVQGIKEVARVLCGGNSFTAKQTARYEGVRDCRAAILVGNGNKGCVYGCLGLGTCEQVCPFSAITISAEMLPLVDEDKCTGCGKCVKECPRGIIEVLPQNKTVLVLCQSTDKGKTVREVCKVGCIGCKACMKACESGAIEVNDNLARIDVYKCTCCGKCADKCPTKSISILIGFSTDESGKTSLDKPA
ncbi:MAG: RnfABCDGE type electron transport complex subunit B [Bacillota bacterium]